MAQRSKWPVSFWKTKASIVALTWRQVRNHPWVTPSSSSRALCCSCPFWQCPQPTFETSDRDLLASACGRFSSELGVHSRRIHRTKSGKKMEITTAMELFERPIYDIWCSKTQASCMNMVILSSLRPISTTCTGPSKPRGHHLDLAWARIYLTLSYHIQDTSRYFEIFQVQFTLNWISWNNLGSPMVLGNLGSPLIWVMWVIPPLVFWVPQWIPVIWVTGEPTAMLRSFCKAELNHTKRPPSATVSPSTWEEVW